MTDIKRDWRQLPRMGKRKRQVLEILDEAYANDAAEGGEPEIDEPQWGWLTREEILANVVSLDTGKKVDQIYSPMTGLVLEIAPQALRDKYNELTDKAHDVGPARTIPSHEGLALIAEKLEDFRRLENFVRESLLPLRYGQAFKSRWDATRVGCYAAIRALKKQGFIESEVREATRRAGLLHFRITPAGRSALEPEV